MAKPNKTARKPVSKDGPLYEVTALSYIDGRLVGPGSGNADNLVVYEGIPGSALIPRNAAAEKAKKAALEAKASARLAPNSAGKDLQELYAERDKLAQERASIDADKAKLERERLEFAEAQKAAAAKK